MSNTKSLLIVNRHAPYDGMYAKEAMDAALIGAAFNQKVSVMFMDDGVYQLLREQAPADIRQKNTSLTLPMLDMYDINNVYVERASLQARNLTEENLLIPVQVIDSVQASELLGQQDIILNF